MIGHTYVISLRLNHAINSSWGVQELYPDKWIYVRIIYEYIRRFSTQSGVRCGNRSTYQSERNGVYSRLSYIGKCRVFPIYSTYVLDLSTYKELIKKQSTMRAKENGLNTVYSHQSERTQGVLRLSYQQVSVVFLSSDFLIYLHNQCLFCILCTK